MFTLNWLDLGRIILIGFLAYVALIIMLRIAGKRTLTQLNAFDLVITVSIGSVFGTILLDDKISLFDGLTAFFVLIGLQWLFAKTTQKSEVASDVVNADAALLYYDGVFCRDAMKKEKIQKQELIQTARMNGHLSMDQIQAIVLESNGEFSILPKSELGKEENIKHIKRKAEK